MSDDPSAGAASGEFVGRLRNWEGNGDLNPAGLIEEAADTIDTLTRERDSLAIDLREQEASNELLTEWRDRAEAAEAEQRKLVWAVGEHITKRSELLARAEATEALARKAFDEKHAALERALIAEARCRELEADFAEAAQRVRANIDRATAAEARAQELWAERQQILQDAGATELNLIKRAEAAEARCRELEAERNAAWQRHAEAETRLVETASDSRTIITTLRADLERKTEALTAAESWLERWASHVGKCAGGSQCTCGLTAIHYEARAALSPPASTEQ